MAKELHLALPTVKQYCSRLYAKFGVSNRTELAVRILGKPRP
ncbi:LuxR C-terminal-related transcriptional regulator [Desulforudis sp. 1088]